jgi:aminoglycoside phosphotransferase (APT) family kinase protein
MAHGDFQSHNLMFRCLPNGQLSNELVTIIDWQLVFLASALNDLGKFMAMAVEHERRERLKQKAFDEYYNELLRIHGEAGVQVLFSYEQVQTKTVKIC